MPRVAPFRALVFDPTVAGPLDRLTAPPYDVISDDRRDRYLAGSPNNIVHLDLSEGSDDPKDPSNRYARAAALLRRWREDGVMALTDPAYFAYEMRFHLEHRPGRLRGVFCAMDLEPWGGLVLPHEETMPGPVEDRLRLLRETRTHISGIYGTINGPCAPLGELLDRVGSEPPLREVVDEEGVEHRMWAVPADEPVDAWLANEALLIADGHHRYTTALAYRDERHALDGPGPWDRIMTLVVDAGTEAVPVLPYHRVQVRGSVPEGGTPVADLHALLHEVDDGGLRIGVGRPLPEGEVGYTVHRLRGEPPAVRALHDELLDREAPGDAIWFTHEADEADQALRDGLAVGAYFLPPTTPDRIRKVIDAGVRLPRKSTFFWPKPRTGLLLMPLDPSATGRPTAGAPAS